MDIYGLYNLISPWGYQKNLFIGIGRFFLGGVSQRKPLFGRLSVVSWCIAELREIRASSIWISQHQTTYIGKKLGWELLPVLIDPTSS